MMPDEQYNDNAMTYLCSLEVLRDDLKAALRGHDTAMALRILKEINCYSAQYIRILEADQ